MSFLGSFNPINIVKNLVDPVVQLARGNISKAASSFTTIVTSGGLSTVSPQIKAALDPVIGKLYDPKLIPAVIGATTKIPLLNAAGAYSVGPQPFLGSIKLPPVMTPPIVTPPPLTQNFAPIAPQGVQPMGLDLGGIFNSIGTIFGGNQNPVFDTISNVSNLASNLSARPQLPAPTPRLPVPVPRGMVPGPAIGRRFFDKYPNLATAMQMLRNQGRDVKRSQLWSLLKRFGPDLLISGGILTAAAVSELMMAGPGRRRMNPGNSKALRRSLRRIEAFHHLCVRADKIRAPRRRAKSAGSSRSTQQFVRQG